MDRSTARGAPVDYCNKNQNLGLLSPIPVDRGPGAGRPKGQKGQEDGTTVDRPGGAGRPEAQEGSTQGSGVDSEHGEGLSDGRPTAVNGRPMDQLRKQLQVK